LKYKKVDTHYVPKKTLTYIIVIFVMLNGLAVIRGGDEFQSIIGIKYNSASIHALYLGYWVFTVIILMLILSISYFTKRHLEEKQSEMEDVGYLARRGDIVFNWKNYASIWTIGFVSSFMGGLTVTIISHSGTWVWFSYGPDVDTEQSGPPYLSRNSWFHQTLDIFVINHSSPVK
jgi:hypothetical protein